MRSTKKYKNLRNKLSGKVLTHQWSVVWYSEDLPLAEDSGKYNELANNY